MTNAFNKMTCTRTTAHQTSCTKN